MAVQSLQAAAYPQGEHLKLPAPGIVNARSATR